MPIYEYICEACDYEWIEDKPITAEKTEECPECKEKRAKRLISKGGNFILQGGGWFKNGGY